MCRSDRAENNGLARFRAVRRCGVAAAELAIMLPFLSLMFVTALDFCRVFHVSQTIQNSARVAALYASGTAQNPQAASVDAAAKQAAAAECASLNPPLDTNNVSITIGSGQAVAQVKYDFPLLTPIMGSSGTITITRSVTMALAPMGP
jgi:Flp pilus assembly protein TadG